MTKMIRISDTLSKNLDTLAKSTGNSKQKILEKAVDSFMRDLFLKITNEQFAQLKKDPKAWKQYQDEIEEWDATLLDGLEDDI